MSAFGSWMDATIAAGAAKTSEIDLADDYDYLELLVPSMDECKLSLEVAEASGKDYYELGKDVSTDADAFNRAAVWRLGGFHFIKIVASAKQQFAVTFRIRGWRY